MSVPSDNSDAFDFSSEVEIEEAPPAPKSSATGLKKNAASAGTKTDKVSAVLSLPSQHACH